MAGNDALAARLSQEKESLKRGWCMVCGEPTSGKKHRKPRHCRVHNPQRLSERGRNGAIVKVNGKIVCY
jgi:hypothetical protein